MDGCVAVGGVKIDDSVSYCAAACWAGVIDNEVQRHLSFPSVLSERRTLKRVRSDDDVARTQGHLAMASQSVSDAATLPGSLSIALGQICTVKRDQSAFQKGPQIAAGQDCQERGAIPHRSADCVSAGKSS
jgi:hypothetical protein